MAIESRKGFRGAVAGAGAETAAEAAGGGLVAQAAPDGKLLPELADVLEVLQALARAHDMSWEDVVSEAGRKRAERGGFDKRIFLEYVEQAR